MVRTRIAPSPTGEPHVGTAYIALFNYCFARQHGGQFLLRIEDTDQKRSSRESEESILDSLRWLGLQWDEGPDVGGSAGPYRQSERSELYATHVQTLLDKGDAFRCFCTAERLDAVRAEQRANKQDPRYDGHCIGLEADEVQAKMDAGESFVVRMKVPDEGTCIVNDLFRGEIAIDWSTVDMQVLMKSDGLPTYHLANVVDDHCMGITHVFRGEEWISSAPKHLLLYGYFGWDAPVLGHMPLLRNPDKSKLSKRKNPTSIWFYKRMGYQPEALLNYLAMLGWSMPDEQEKFTIEEMIEQFSIERVSKGGPVFDIAKLDWLNSLYIREMDDERFASQVQQWALHSDYMMQIIPLVRQRLNKWSDLGALVWHFFAGEVDVTKESLATKKLDEAQTLQALQWASWRLDAMPVWESEEIADVLKETASLMEVKLRDFLKPFFITMSGKQVSTPLFDTMAVVGRDITRARLRASINALGGVGKKRESKLRKAMVAAERAATERAEAEATGEEGA